MSKLILIVDDEPDLLLVLGLRLKAAGYEILTAQDGQDGFEKAKAFVPDLIILDVMLPKMDGHLVCSLLKSDERYKKIPIIMFTARAQNSDIQPIKDSGEDAFICKPFKPEDMINQIKKLLGDN